MYCTKCGKKLKDGSKICENCQELAVSNVKSEMSFFQRTIRSGVVIYPLLIFLPFLGIPYMWLFNKTYTKEKKMLLTGISAIWFLFIWFLPSNTDKTKPQVAQTHQTQQEKSSQQTKGNAKEQINDFKKKFNSIAKRGNADSSAQIGEITYLEKGFLCYSGNSEIVMINGVTTDGRITAIQVSTIPKSSKDAIYWLNGCILATKTFDSEITEDEAISIIKELSHVEEGGLKELDENTNLRGYNYHMLINNDDGLLFIIKNENKNSGAVEAVPAEKKESKLHMLLNR